MKNVYEVLRQKELEVSRLETEVEALRVAAPLLSEGVDTENDNQLPDRAEAENDNQATSPDSAVRPIEDLETRDTPQQDRAAWGDRAKNWLGR